MRLFWLLCIASVFLLAGCGSSKKTARSSGGSNPSYSVDYNKLPENIPEKFSVLMQVPKERVTNIPLYRFINNWLQTPYKLGGQSRSGVDCSGFIQILFSDIYNKKLPRTSLAQYNESGWLKNRDELKEGDLVFFNTGGSAKVNHVGLYLQNNRFASATTSRGVIITSLTDSYWNKAYVGAGRY